MPESGPATVVPAQVSFLAIYNPSLGPTDETIQQQVVYYTSADQSRRSDILSDDADLKEDRDETNERLRQIGLAQGMVNFARNFSKGQPVEHIETEKSRVVLHELERNWWILASINLTRLPSGSTGGLSSQTATPAAAPSYQYSSRELCPPQLLIQQLRRANSLFLLHNDFTLEGLYHRVGRRVFCRLLEGFWDKFVLNWEVLLSGNPIVEIFNGVKLSAGGELGVGVGEEQWGSGEREVLEDFVSRTPGLVDLVVSRFGDATTGTQIGKDAAGTGGPATMDDYWLGYDAYPRPTDGIIFSGVGAIARTSLVPISHWMESMYRHGDDAYGVGVDPKAARRRRRRRRRGREALRDPAREAAMPTPAVRPQVASPERALSPGIPRPLVTETLGPPPVAEDRSKSRTSSQSTPTGSERGSDWSTFGTDTLMKYLKLGYGSSWSFSSQSPSSHLSATSSSAAVGAQEASKAQPGPVATTDAEERAVNTTEKSRLQDGRQGRFLLGLRDDMEAADDQLSNDDEPSTHRPDTKRQKIVLRTLQVGVKSNDDEERKQLQAVVYARQPFVFLFLFEMDTPSLDTTALYHSIHHQLGPLQKPLLISTAPSTASVRISTAEHASDSTRRFSARMQSEPVYDLVYDPANLTIRSSIPNIPDLRSPHSSHRLPSSGDAPTHVPWSRVESIGVHHRLLSTYIETRSRPHELERTCKTNRGWWVVWIRLSDEPATTRDTRPSTPHSISNTDRICDGMTKRTSKTTRSAQYQEQEAFLVRRASDHPASTTSKGGGAHGQSNSSGSRFLRDLGGASSSSPGSALSRAEMSPAKLVEGLGLDARRYIEGLLSLNR